MIPIRTATVQQRMKSSCNAHYYFLSGSNRRGDTRISTSPNKVLCCIGLHPEVSLSDIHASFTYMLETLKHVCVRRLRDCVSDILSESSYENLCNYKVLVVHFIKWGQLEAQSGRDFGKKKRHDDVLAGRYRR